MVRSLAQDLRYALRTLSRARGFTFVAVLILALGIGANTAIFSLVSAVLLKPLPFPEPDRLMVVWDDFTAIAGPARVEPTLADYVNWKERSRSFTDMAAFAVSTYNLTGDGEPEQLTAARTTTNLFSLLGLQPLLGRTFTPDDEGPDATPVVVIGQNLWKRRFGADPAVVGRKITLDGLAHTVIGIVPPDFRFPNDATSIWVPASFTPEELANRGAYVYDVLGRLGAGTSRTEAQAEMNAIADNLATEYPESNTGIGVTISPLHEQLARDAKPTLVVLLAAVGTVLLITCANVANLLLARGANRRHELALRQALGADSGRLVRLLLTESSLLAGFGLIGGLLISTLVFDYLAILVPAAYPQGAAPGIDWRVLVFAGATTLFTILLFGAGPAIATARAGFSEALRMRTGRIGMGRGGPLRNVLVVAEITMTVILLTVAGLLLRSFAEVLRVDPGFDSENVLIAETPLAASRYADAAERNTFYHRVLERIDALPGVRDAAYASYPPLLFKGGRAMISIDGQPAPTPETLTQYITSDRAVSAGYFTTIGIPLIRGRLIDERDTAEAAPVVVINEAMARARWPNEDPIGQRVKLGRPDMLEQPWHTVVGVVGNVRQMGLDVPPEPEIYFPLEQIPASLMFLWPRHLVVHADGDPLALTGAIRSAVWAVDPDQPVPNPRSMSAILDGELTSRDTQLTLIGSFAVLALGLAAVGLYGVLSYTVAQRRTEIGLRMALGAQRGRVLRTILRKAFALTLLGIALGLGVAFALTRLLSSFVYGVSTTDSATFSGVVLLLLLVAALASYLPARRAARVDPMAALRAD